MFLDTFMAQFSWSVVLTSISHVHFYLLVFCSLFSRKRKLVKVNGEGK
jgi:hypothetical protein